MELVVANRFTLRRKIGSGSFGDIFSGTDLHEHREVAVKLEPARTKSPQLELEYKIYQILEGSVCVPRVYWYGTESKYNILVMDRLGLSLEDIFVQHHNKFSLKTVLMLVDDMLRCIEFVHKRNLVHRDIKPDNFMMGSSGTPTQLYIIDFGLSKRYRDPKTHQHIKMSESKSLTGTARYASVNAMLGKEQSRRDDLESLGYVWLYFLRGSLPWSGIPAKTTEEKMKKITDVKNSTSFEDLCKGFPHEFVEYFEMVRELDFTDEPKYADYRKLFQDLFIKKGFIYDAVYDWSEQNSRLPMVRKSRHPRIIPYTQPQSAALSPRESTEVKKPSIFDSQQRIGLRMPEISPGPSRQKRSKNQAIYTLSNPYFRKLPKPTQPIQTQQHSPLRNAIATSSNKFLRSKGDNSIHGNLPAIDHRNESNLF